MTQALAASLDLHARADDQTWLCGRTVVHKLVFALDAPAACLAAVFAELSRVGGELHSMTLHPTRGGAFEAVVRVTRIGAGEAAVMLDRLARLPDVRSAALEHVLIT